MKKKLKNYKRQIYFISIVLLFFGCNNDSLHKDYYYSGSLKTSVSMSNGKKNGLAIHYYENGNIEGIETYVNDSANGEVFSFYPNGYLERKSIVKMGIPNGYNYGFYSSGSIKDYRMLVNGKKQGYGEDYWGKDGDIKAVYFARNDTLTYERLFDTSGVVIKIRGNSPEVPNSKVNK